MDIEKLKGIIEIIKDPRQEWGNLRHKLVDIMVIGLCTVICGGEDYDDMEKFACELGEWLKGFLELPNVVPDSDTFRRVFERFNNQELRQCLKMWLNIGEGSGGRLVNIDGKTIRGSKKHGDNALHVVSAWGWGSKHRWRHYRSGHCTHL